MILRPALAQRFVAVMVVQSLAVETRSLVVVVRNLSVEAPNFADAHVHLDLQTVVFVAVVVAIVIVLVEQTKIGLETFRVEAVEQKAFGGIESMPFAVPLMFVLHNLLEAELVVWRTATGWL